ncbi:hypothetical protein P7H41_10725 [Vagococcus fluvialis]|uniref:hypothetical protein n=1 Tax=Vagococcus fluvialis TaxID=2738 RepID=UPI00288E19C5|nr:hypothetical protein [Vagococcus fluvialis]MDT2782429.1 hypothetical protein [Vagococcus fluvialis]
MTEIGGYFGLEDFKGEEYHLNAIRLNSARNAIIYIMKVKKIQKIFIPYFLCDSVKNVLVREKFLFEEYHIDEELMPIIDFELKENEYILIVNYFGQILPSEMINLKNKLQNIIIDNTQSFYSKEIKDIVSFNSCRKFFGVSDGSYLYIENELEEKIDNDFSGDRMTHIIGRYEKDASEYYKYFVQNDKKMISEPLKQMSALTQNLLKVIDYDRTFDQRNINYDFLFEEFHKINKLKLKKIKGAFCYPLYIEDGEKIREVLISKKIYIPLLWPEVLKKNEISVLEGDFARNIVHLPCDQRYDIDDMKKVVKEVKKCLNLEN